MDTKLNYCINPCDTVGEASSVRVCFCTSLYIAIIGKIRVMTPSIVCHTPSNTSVHILSKTYHCNGNRSSRLNTTHCGIDPQDTLRYHKQRMLPTETRARNPEGTVHRGKSSRSMLQHNTSQKQPMGGQSSTDTCDGCPDKSQCTFAKQPVVSA